MNKLVKGSIAGAAGIALLLGGAGTLAYWNSEADFSGTTIEAGTLEITNDSAAAAVTDQDGNPISLIVPGDVVTVSQGVSIDASGDNLHAKLTIDEAALLGNLAGHVSVDVAAFAGTSAIGDLSDLDVSELTSITSIAVEVTFDSSTAGLDGQDGSLDLGELVVMLTQLAP